jgi:hypothetical protein
MKNVNYLLLATLALSVTFSSCRKAQEIEYNDDIEANFTYSLTQYTVTFLNTSKGLSSYMWDFGDGTTSNEKNPVHQYPAGKGEYLITLSSGETKGHTILNIDKFSPVNLEDGSLEDWNSVTTNVINSGGAAGVALKGKFDYNADYVFFYIEQEGTLADGTIITAFFNTDTNNITGFYPGSFTDLGVDHYFEGQLLQGADNWLDPYSFSGDDDHVGWNWESKDFGDFWKVGHYIEDAGTVKYEFALDRNKFPGLKNNSITIGISILDSDWSDIGYLPDGDTAGFELNLNE